MKAKKENSLAMELIDDLLSEEDSKAEAAVPGDEQDLIELESGEAQELSQEGSDSFSVRAVDPRDSLASSDEEDATIRLAEPSTPQQPSSKSSSSRHNETLVGQTTSGNEPSQSQRNIVMSKGVRAAVGRYASSTFQGGSVGPQDAALIQSENLSLAQEKILELEKEVERLRHENEELAAAGETIEKRADELLAQVDQLSARYEDERKTFDEERNVFLDSLKGKAVEVEELKIKNDELQMRLSTNIQKIRVRERELENRLELLKMEGRTIVRSKDEMILDLKRQLDQANHELGNYRLKSQELNKNLEGKHEVLRRTVKALRLALAMLEGQDEDVNLKKKVK